MRRELKNASEDILNYMDQNYPDIVVAGLDEENTLYLETLGECSGCPHQCMSKEGDLQQALPQIFPDEIARVSVSQHISSDTLDLARRMLGLSADA